MGLRPAVMKRCQWVKPVLVVSERIRSDKQLEKTFLADLQHLCDDEDIFQWPLDDPHYCLVLGLLKKYYDRLIAKLSEAEELSEDEDQDEDDEEDEADWWKSTE